MPMEEYVKLTGDTFDAWVKENDGVVIVHKKLCPHCQIMSKVLDKLRAKAPLAVACVDSEEETGLCERLGVSRVPTLCATGGGEVRKTFTGIMNPAETARWYEEGRRP